jgi:hypothetical protein
MKKITAKIALGDQTLYINNNIDSAEIESLTKGDLSNIIDYGIYSNKGTISFFDYDKSFHNLMETNPTDVKVQTYASNPVSDKLIGTFLIDDYDYDDETKLVSLTLKDKLLSWQNISFEDIRIFNTKSLYYIISQILSSSRMSLSDVDFSANAMDILQRINVYCPIIVGDTLWSAINKVCQASMCRVCCNENGTPKFYYDVVESQNPITINSKDILQIENQLPARKNRIYSVAVPFKKREKYTEKLVGDISLYVNDIQAVTDENEKTTIQSSKYVGADSSRNGESVVQLLPSADGKTTYSVSTTINLREGTTAVGNIFLNVSGYYGINNAYGYTPIQNFNCTYYNENYASNIKEKKVNVSFKFDRPNYSAARPILIDKIYIGVNGDYYEDGEDLYFYTNPYALSYEDIQVQSNELMQTKSKIDLGIDGSQDLKTYYTWFGKKIGSRFYFGANCCEMDCLAVDYYEANSNSLVVNGNNKSGEIGMFSIQDVVIPYVTRSGYIAPYKSKPDGSSASFAVVGIKYLYNGILTQKLLLQEITPQNNLIRFYINNTGYFTYEGDTWEDFANRNKNIFYTKSTAPDNLVTTQVIDGSNYNVYSDDEGRYMTYDDIIVEDGIYSYVDK